MADRSILRALLNPDPEKWLALFPPQMREIVEIEKFVFKMRHQQAIQILIAAEQFLCRDRVSCLFEVVSDLEPEALPELFFRRLCLLESRLRTKGNRGPRNPERDGDIFGRFKVLRNAPLPGRDASLKYEQALEKVGDEYALSPKAIETIIGGGVDYDLIGHGVLNPDLRRLQDYMSRWPSPKND